MTNIEVLVSTMNQEDDDFSLVEKMNIQTDAIIINQTDHFAFNKRKIKGNIIKIYSFDEKGVGLSRNNGLMRSNAEICMMADDDMVFVNNYDNIILNAFKQNSKADFVISNVRIHYPDKSIEKVKSNGKLKYNERFRYGTVTFAFRRRKIIKNNILFSLLFGGGTQYGSGEDTLFLWSALKNGLNVFTNKEIVADVYNYNSSWFQGFNDKYYFDKGALYKALSPNINFFLNLYLVLRTSKYYKGDQTFIERLKIMHQGADQFKKLS